MSDRIKQLRDMLQSEPNDPFCLYGLALEHAKRGEHGLAVELFDRTLAVDPNYCYGYFHKARSQEELGESKAALETLRAGLARARAASDAKATSEIAGYLDELDG